MEKKGVVKDRYLFNTKISLTNPDEALNLIKNYDHSKSGFVSLFGLYPLIKSIEDPYLRKALNQSYLNPLHGKLIEAYLRLKGEINIKSVDGNYFLDQLLRDDITHYFYGSSRDTLFKIQKRVESEYPNANVIGYLEPPIIDLKEIRKNPRLKRDFIEMNKERPDIIWVGLGGIKQDLVMHHYAKYLDRSLMIGVGAVFDYFAGNLKLSSNTVKNFGFRWLQRLIQEPHLIKKKVEIARILISLPFKKTR